MFGADGGVGWKPVHIKTAFRVHIRGYAHWRDGMDNRFIDIILGRVMEAKIDTLAGLCRCGE